MNSLPSATYTVAAPYSASRAWPSAAPAPAQTTRGLAELARERQQFQGDLLDLAAGVLGEDQNLSHIAPPLR